jgi:hypothetical protein
VQTAGDCKKSVCDGAGATVSVNDVPDTVPKVTSEFDGKTRFQ